jgi:hypothetical protein
MAINPGWFVLAPLIPLFMALGPASIMIWLVRRHLRNQPLETDCWKAVARMPRRSFPSRANWVSHSGFAQGDAGLWIAVRSRGVESLTSKQGLKRSIFRQIPYLKDAPIRVSMPWRGWALLSSPALPDFTDDVDAVYHLTSTLAEVFQEVQFYSFNRLFNHHGWVWAKNASIQRAYAWAGETLWNQGPVTEEELQLRMNLLDYGETPPISFTEPSLNFEAIEAGDYFLDSPMSHKENSEKILLLAQLWSVDPRMVEETILDDK